MTQDLIDSARRNLAVGPPAEPGESAASAFHFTRKVNTTLGAVSMVADEYDGYLKEIERTTGKRLFNPMLMGVKERAKSEAQLFERATKLSDKFPNLVVRSPEAIRTAVGRRRARLRLERGEVERRETGFSSVAAFAGAAGATLLDPPIAGSMLFGAGFSTAILRGALIDAGIGAGVEVAVQANIQSSRRQFGEKPSLGEAALAVAGAGVGGFVLSGVLRGAVKAAPPAGRALVEQVRKLRRRSPEVDDAAEYVARQADMEAASPFDDTPSGRAEHVERYDEALEAVREGRRSNAPQRPVNPVSRADKPGRALNSEPPPARENNTLHEQLGKQLGEAAREAVRDAIDLTERQRAALFSAASVADDPQAFAALVRQIRRPPGAEGRRLLTFLKRSGGLQEEAGELAAIGITSRTRPGLIRRGGLNLDEAGLRAFEAGFFQERPTIAVLLDAIRDDFTGIAPRMANPADEVRLAEAAQLNELGDALTDQGIDVLKLRPEQARGLVREAAQRVRETPGPAQRGMTDSRVEADSLGRMETEQDVLDAAMEADVRRAYEGDEGATVLVEDEDGNLLRLTVGEMFDDFAADARLVDEFRGCLG